jgi:putative nucleotidyltransferase with HDIG domain
VQLSLIRRLIPVLDTQDEATARHAQRVCLYVLRLACEMGLDSRECLKLRLAARLHDLGKTRLPTGLIEKPGRLTPEERRRMESHAVLGEELVRKFISDQEVTSAVRSHHERFDGAGYPDGIRGTRIPLLARILAIADSFDAMTSERPYRQPVSVALALASLADGSGTQFDPWLVPFFLKATVRA